MANLTDIDNIAPAHSLKAGADVLNTWRARLDELHQTLGLGSLTAVEVTQLQAIGTVTILNTQWGYLGACTAAGGALLDDANASAQRTTLGLAIGTDVQAYDADLSAIAALTKTDGNFIVGNGSTWVAESGATARTSLGLGSMAIQAHGSVNIDGGTIGGVTLDGAIAGGDQAFTGVGDMTFTNGSILKSGASASDTLLLAANDTTCITLTTGATDKVEFASVNALTAINDIDIGAHNLRAATMTADGLTATRVIFAGASGLLSDNANMTFSTDTLTVKKLVLNDATTATTDMLTLTPAGAVATTATWKGIYIDGDALDPSGVNAAIEGIYVDLSGVASATGLEMRGVYASVPTGLGYEALHIIGKIKLDNDESSLAAGETATGIDIIVLASAAGGGEYHAIDVATTGTSAASLTALGTHTGIDVIHQHAGAFISPTKAWTYDDSGSSYAEVTTEFGSAGSDVTIFDEDDDAIFVGADAVFDEIEVILETAASVDIKPTFFYSKTASFQPFFPADDTEGFTQDGIIRFVGSDLDDFAAQDVEGTSKFYIKIVRTKNNVVTDPIEDTIKTLAATECFWNSVGALQVVSIGAFEATGAINFGSQAMTNVDINSGSIDGTTIGAASAAAGTFVALTATGAISFDGGAFTFNTTEGDLDVRFAASSITNAFYIDGATGKVFINDNANASALGPSLTIDGAGNDGDYFTCQDSTQIAHGMTTRAETDTFFMFTKAVQTQGGVQFKAFTEGDYAITFRAAVTSETNARNTEAEGAIQLWGELRSGTTTVAMSADKNLLVIRSLLTTRVVFDTDGEMHSDAVIGTGDDWDEWDDLALASDVSRLTPGKYNEMLKYHAEDFEKAGLVTLSTDDDGIRHAFIKNKAMHLFSMNCFREVYNRMIRYERAFEKLGIDKKELLELEGKS